MEEDSTASIAHYCLHKLHMLPSQFLALDEEDKAFVIASITLKAEKERKEAERIKRKGKK